LHTANKPFIKGDKFGFLARAEGGGAAGVRAPCIWVCDERADDDLSAMAEVDLVEHPCYLLWRLQYLDG
jgi:hypothetical protein